MPISTPTNSPSHSVIAGKLFLTIQAITDFLKVNEKILTPEARESMLSSMGSLASQTDMIVEIERIPLPERTEKQTSLLKELRDAGESMNAMVKEVLDSFPGALNIPTQIGDKHE